jgi:hypothetical protein
MKKTLLAFLITLSGVGWASPVIQVVINPPQREPGTCVWEGQDLKSSFVRSCCSAGLFTGAQQASCPYADTGQATIRNGMIKLVGLDQNNGTVYENADNLTSGAPSANIEQAPPISVPAPSTIEFPGPAPSPVLKKLKP